MLEREIWVRTDLQFTDPPPLPKILNTEVFLGGGMGVIIGILPINSGFNANIFYI
jgi:hypothetical protein